MKILLIFPLCPLPLNSGGQIRVWNIVRELRNFHTIDLVCFIRDDAEKKYEAELKTIFNSVTFIKRKKLFDRSMLIQGGLSAITFFQSNIELLFSSLFSSRPLLGHLYDSEEMRNYIRKVDTEKKYDLFYAETFYGIASLKYILAQIKAKILLIDQNIESIAYDRQSKQQKNPIVRMLMYLDVLKIRREEEFFWNSVEMVGALSDVDRGYIEQRTGKKALLVENGVDSAWFSQKVTERISSEILFVGTFSYFQNVDSLKWFLDSIWPRIIVKTNMSLSLHIVGRGADAALKEYVSGLGYTIDESVDDIRYAFQRATLLAAPIRAGSGTKYKVLEAMASGLPVLTTPVGAEGLAITPGTEMLVAQEEEQFAEFAIQLLQNQKLRESIGIAGYSFVKEAYDWKTIVHKFVKQLENN